MPAIGVRIGRVRGVVCGRHVLPDPTKRRGVLWIRVHVLRTKGRGKLRQFYRIALRTRHTQIHERSAVTPHVAGLYVTAALIFMLSVEFESVGPGGEQWRGRGRQGGRVPLLLFVVRLSVFRSNMGLHCSDMLRRFVRYLRVSAQAWRRPCAVRRGGSENGLGRCQWLIDHVSCDAWVRSWLAI